MSQEPFNTEDMAKEFLYRFSGQAFTVGQLLAFSFNDRPVLLLVVKDLEGECSDYYYARWAFRSNSTLICELVDECTYKGGRRNS